MMMVWRRARAGLVALLAVSLVARSTAHLCPTDVRDFFHHNGVALGDSAAADAVPCYLRHPKTEFYQLEACHHEQDVGRSWSDGQTRSLHVLPYPRLALRSLWPKDAGDSICVAVKCGAVRLTGGSFQLYHVYPRLRVFYPFSWENGFDATLVSEWMGANPWLLWGSGAAYLLLVFGGQLAMRKVAPFRLKWALAGWNLTLALFSISGTVRTLPHVLSILNHHGLRYVLCTNPLLQGQLVGALSFWTAAFILSKIAELFDTFFLVLRRRPVIFLHWYHHLVTMALCWHLYIVRSSLGLPFMTANYLTHSVMYTYYTAKTLEAWPCTVSPVFITVLQTTQMMGSLVCMAAYQYYLRSQLPDRPCYRAETAPLFSEVAYATFLVLFGRILLKRFIRRKPRTDAAPAEAAESANAVTAYGERPKVA